MRPHAPAPLPGRASVRLHGGGNDGAAGGAARGLDRQPMVAKGKPTGRVQGAVMTLHCNGFAVLEKLLESSGSKYTNNKLFWKEGVYPHWLGVIEKWLQLRTILKELNLVFDDHPYQCVHLMDNMGIVNRLIANSARAPVSVSAMSYQDKKPRWLYKMYIRISYKYRKLTIIPYSQTFADKLLELGLDASKVHRIPWGVHITTEINI